MSAALQDGRFFHPAGAAHDFHGGTQSQTMRCGEHFEFPDAGRLTAECFRVLAPCGVLRVCVPDGIEFWQKYLDLFQKIMAMPRPQRSDEPLREHVQMYFNEISTRKLWFGSTGAYTQMAVR